MRVGFVGGGVMADAMVRGALAAGMIAPNAFAVSDPNAHRREHFAALGAAVTDSNRDVAKAADVVVLAVKPYHAPRAMGDLAGTLQPGQTVLSIMAGVPIRSVVETARHDAVVRAVPNTPARVGAGISGWMASPTVGPPGRGHAVALLGSLGAAIEVEDESALDMVTALSGSGPAYVLLFLEALIDAGVHVGLQRPVAERLAVETLLGTVRLAQSGAAHPAELRNMVTSPAGTTAAGLAALEAGGFRSAVDRAVVAAFERCRALGRVAPEGSERG